MSRKVSKKVALLNLYHWANQPAKAGRVWVQYPRESVEVAISVLRQLLEKEGYEFRPEKSP